MDLTQLANLGEFIGGAAVLVTLIYLALQVGHNTRAVRATNHQAQMDGHAHYLMAVAGDPVLSGIFDKLWVEDGRGSLNEAEAQRCAPLLHTAFGQFETAFRSHEEGLISGAWWEKQASALDVWLRSPDIREWWRQQGTIFPADFANHVERRLVGLEES